MNIQVYKRLANVLGLSGLLILSNASVNAETIVHTTRYSYDTETSANNSPQVEKTNYKAPSKANNKSVKKNEIKPHRPIPYSWDAAVDYAKIYPEDITIHKIGGYKDKYGNFSKWRCLDFLGDQGLCNRGDSFWGVPEQTYLRIMIHYGQETNPPMPFALIIWAADINRYEKDNNDRNPYHRVQEKREPRFLRIVFESGYEKEFSTDWKDTNWYYYRNFNIYDILYFPLSLFIPTSVADRRKGYIFLTSEDVWDIYKHGNIANVYLDDGRGFGMSTGTLSFFYSGDKQEEHKEQITYAFEHMVSILNINPATLAYEKNKRKETEEREYREKIRSRLKNEVKQDMIVKDLMEEVKEEVKAEIQLGKKAQ
ncbi:MAG: hypothetical protein J6O04_03530 [Selenomonadaceae bacterium]|nr:hypothetical protein [Selenomonadaceae bacterium]